MTILTKYNEAPINKVKIENRDYIISKLETGNLLKTKAETNALIFHYGIVEKDIDGLFIIHNHPDKFNSKGGNTVREPLEKWIKNRHIVSVEQTNLKLEDIEKIYEELEKYKYDFINFNCEHFVNFATEKKLVSNQVFKWGSIIAIGVLVTYLIRKNKI